jgi:hypothetical protein
MRRPILFMVMVMVVAAGAAASPVVVVNPNNPVRAITREEARKLLVGEQLAWAAGDATEVIEVKGDDAAVADGYLSLTRKTLGQVRAAWNRLVFSGQADPPIRFETAAEVKAAVAHRRAAIAVIDESVVDGTVRVVLRVRDAR